MTIAAGFRCQDSIILCADRELTYPTLKLAGDKIFPLNVPQREMNIAFAASGTLNFARSAFQFIKRGLLALPLGVCDETSLQVFLEDQLCQFYDKHIFKHPRYGYTDGPQIYFVIAAQFKNENTISLFSTDETTVNPEPQYCFAGSGAELAKYIVDPLAGLSLACKSPKDILLIATHVLVQVQNSAGNCGQGSQFFRLACAGDFHPVYNFPLPDVAEYSNAFQAIVEALFFAAADLDLDDPEVKSGLRFTKYILKKIRQEQKHERDRREELRRQLFGLNNAK